MKPQYSSPALIGALVIGMGSAPVLAGSLEDPVIAPPPAPPVIVPAGADWTGFYGGVQLGYGDVDSSASGVDGDGAIGGLILGYDYDFGSYVLGAGLDYDIADIDLGSAATLEDVLRLKLRAGVEAGPALIYATGGYARAGTDNLGSDDGYFIGAGVDYPITEAWTLGGELLYHEFDDFDGSGVDVDATTLQARLSFRF
ncbi:outer membrane protein [Dinoroseobacter sp. S124A]|uniref:outer membrane protein n=1 Tax=Dinoroseobacter sp. S124A TaxID=3415128 RepID=UPI003C7B88BD